MVDVNIGNATASTNAYVDYSVTAQDTDGVLDQDETTWQMTDWSINLGYYKTIPELQTAIDAKANWTIGAGFTADEPTTVIMNNFRGYGKDSANTILMNLIRVYTIGGDAFAEIIRNDNGLIMNLKPIDPSTIKIVVGQNGRIKRYEQVSKNKNVVAKFKPNEIFHLSRNRLADEVHGISIIPSVQWIINARNEAMTDYKRVLHRNIDPLWIFHLDTDDTTQIANFKAKMDSARANGENMYIPKDAVVPELVTTAANATLNPITWINQLNDYFFQAVNVPQIVIGNAKEFTDASAKIVYLSFEQSVKKEQLYIEEQVLNQLNMIIQLTFPASVQQDAVSDDSKAPTLEASKPADTAIPEDY